MPEIRIMLTVLAPAKINLSLEVIRGRSDGYHDLLSVVQTVSLADALSLRPGPGRSIRCLDHELERGNLAERAAGILAERFGVSDGVRIDLHKRIPVAAGLGGGSTDAAAALAGLSRFWELEAGCRELEPIAAEIGSDVPFFLYGGTALVSGRGEIVTSLPAPRSTWYLLANPGFPVSTARIYEQLPADDWANGETTRHIASQIQETGQVSLGINALQATLFRLYPAAHECFQAVSAVSGGRALVSGSGPTIIAHFQSLREAESAARTLNPAVPWTAVVRGIERTGWETPCA